jgi:holo-[acyl-carrier protein] synthase
MTRHEIGIDLIDIDRIVGVLGRHPSRFRQRVLTEHEQRYVGRKVERLAGRWAAKEAISKVLGLGVRGVGWREIEVLPNRAGQPQVYLHGRAAIRAEDMGLDEVSVSISHERHMAVAVAVAHRRHD